MNNLPTSISKKDLWKLINKKLNRKIHHFHVFSIISILFEEMLNDLKAGKEIKIFNFGKLSLFPTKPSLHFDLFKKKLVVSSSYKLLRFLLAPKIAKKIKKHLDIEKTFVSIDGIKSND